MSYKIQWEINGVIVRFSGVHDLNDCSQAGEEIYSSPKCNSINYVIWDLSNIENLNFNSEQVELAALRDKVGSERLSDLRMGFIVQGSETENLCLQYIKKSLELGSPWDFKVSFCFQETREWINRHIKG